MPLFGRKKPAAEPVDAPASVDAPLARWDAEDFADAVLAGVTALRPFGMQIHDVAGLTLCEDIVSDLDLPMVTMATADGYGVRAANIVGAARTHPIDLYVVGDATSHVHLPGEALPAGACVRVAEGAALPRGVDAVVPLAAGHPSERTVTFIAEASVGDHVTLAGSIVADGQKLLASGTILDPRSIALLAEVGLDKVLVRPRPRLVVVSIGAELVSPGLPITSVAQHYGASSALIAASAKADGATVYPIDHALPDVDGIAQLLSDQLIRSDAIVVLVESDADARLICDVLSGLGSCQMGLAGFDGEHVLAVARAGSDRVPVLVLPGRPVTAFAAYHAFVRPLLDRLGARGAAPAARTSGVLADDLDADGTGPRFVPGQLLDDQVVAASGSGAAIDLARADVLVIVPPGAGLKAGSEVECLLLDASRAERAAPAASE